ncbi:MAG: hypothetical protein COT00_03750 [Candidatus Omnitrophica bacterium CG07_land_8_20_14_0_80_50_8]|nr:MAG: hypothetical protein COT00_03750 [Candidatus Omnitrophica bacterium CG07_land_8_20_14_0_80_50_8]
MKKKIRSVICCIFFLNVCLSGAAGRALAADKEKIPTSDLPVAKESLMTNGYVLESDSETASESLERISGKIDMGFSSPENSFKSDDHYGVGPTAYEKSRLGKQSTDE